MSIQHFVSYSRADRDSVVPIVRLLRSCVDQMGTIFLDADSIEPGALWRDAISAAICNCKNFYVFWCHHSATSDEVANELLQAVKLQKTIIPVLLDDTQMPAELARYNGVDFRVSGLHQRNPDLKPENEVELLTRSRREGPRFSYRTSSAKGLLERQDHLWKNRKPNNLIKLRMFAEAFAPTLGLDASYITSQLLPFADKGPLWPHIGSEMGRMSGTM